MERLTVRRKDGRAAIANKDGASPLEQTMKIPVALDRLAAYEDTNCTPDEFTSALDSAAKLISTMRNNKKAALWMKKYGAAEAALEAHHV